MTKEQAAKELAKIVKEAQDNHKAALEKAIALADQYGLCFTWDYTYGSRQQEYLGKGCEYFDWNSKQILTEGKWTSSSDGC